MLQIYYPIEHQYTILNNKNEEKKSGEEISFKVSPVNKSENNKRTKYFKEL